MKAPFMWSRGGSGSGCRCRHRRRRRLRRIDKKKRCRRRRRLPLEAGSSSRHKQRFNERVWCVIYIHGFTVNAERACLLQQEQTQEIHTLARTHTPCVFCSVPFGRFRGGTCRAVLSRLESLRVSTRPAQKPAHRRLDLGRHRCPEYPRLAMGLPTFSTAEGSSTAKRSRRRRRRRCRSSSE